MGQLINRIKINQVQVKLSLCLGLLLAVGLLTGCCVKAQSIREESLAMYQGNPKHTGYFETKSVKDKPKVKWKFETQDAISVAPVVYRGVVYIGCDDDRLYAIDEATGRQIWRFEAEGNIRSTPCVSEEGIYLTSEAGRLYKVNPASGEEIWRFSGQKKADLYDYCIVNIGSSPVMDQEKVYYGGPDGIVYALDKETGKAVWSYPIGTAIKSSPALYKNKLYIGSLGGQMVCLNSSTGRLEWQYKTKSHSQSNGNVTSSPTLVDDGVYFGGDDFHVYGLKADTGEEIFAVYAADQPIFSTLATKDDSLYYGTCGWHNAMVCRVDLSGKNKWSFKVPKKNRSILDEKGNVSIGDWSSTEDEYYASPVIAEDTLYISTWNNTLYALNSVTGELRWSYSDLGRLAASVAVHDGVVFVGSYDGFLYALTDQ